MPNSYFQFKQFRVEQGQSGMKVTTDGCFFGATIPSLDDGTVLDIGAGTGLLSLMMAQKSPNTQIEAIEIDQSAFEEATMNVQNAPWHNRIKVRHTSLQSFDSSKKYDLIMSNPPFFKDNFKGDSVRKNKAIHNDSLSFEELAQKASILLSDLGQLWVMYPAFEMSQFIKIATDFGLYVHSLISLRNKLDGPILRQISQLGKTPMSAKTSEDIHIRSNDGAYSQEFTDLLKDYYLHL